MNYNLYEYRYPSADGENTVYAEIYTPKETEVKGVVQLAHGMIDYTGRYLELADYLCKNGYVFAGNHHLGHGNSAKTADDLGHFADNGGYEYVLEDLDTFNEYLHKTYPAVPLILLGHSMGSFISRLYAQRHPRNIDGLIIHGTGGPNPLVGAGKLLAGIIKAFRGPRHRSALIENMAFGSYNSKYPKEEGHNAWLTREGELVKDRDTNKFTSFKFTVSSYIVLFNFLADSNSKKWFREYPKELPTLIMSGDMDPVGDYGKGPHYVYKQLMVNGVSNVKLKMYEGARHELFNETCRQEVFADITDWLEGVKK